MQAASRRFDRGNGVFGAALHQQGMAKDVQGLGVARLCLEDVTRDPFRVLRTLAVQGEYRTRKRLIATARAAGPRICKLFRHRYAEQPLMPNSLWARMKIYHSWRAAVIVDKAPLTAPIMRQ